MVRFPVRVRPGSSRAWVGGSYDGRLGPALVVAVTARAVEGAANDAVLAVLAEAFGVRWRDVAILTGSSSRDKVVQVSGATPGVLARLMAGTGSGRGGV